MTDEKKRFECYLNIQSQDGSKSKGVIISGSGETVEEAKTLFNHAMKTYREEKQ